MVIVPPAGENLTAFEIRLVSTWFSRSRSPATEHCAQEGLTSVMRLTVASCARAFNPLRLSVMRSRGGGRLRA